MPPNVRIQNYVPTVGISGRGRLAALNIWTYDQNGVEYDQAGFYYDGTPPVKDVFQPVVRILNT